MKTIFRTAIIACVALATSLASCQKGPDENGGGSDGEKSIGIRLVKPATATRAPGEHVKDGTDLELRDAYIYFTDMGGKILDYVVIDFSASGINKEYSKVTKTVGYEVATSATGCLVKGLPPSVMQVAIVANLPGGTGYTSEIGKSIFTGSGHSIDTSGLPMITVESQHDATDGGVANVTLFGLNDNLPAPDANGITKADVEIKPICARIEIGSISSDLTYYNDIKMPSIDGWHLEGIYINNYYPSMDVDGRPTYFDSARNVRRPFGVPVNNGSDETKYNGFETGSAYADLNGVVADYYKRVAGQPAEGEYAWWWQAYQYVYVPWDDNDDMYGQGLFWPEGSSQRQEYERLLEKNVWGYNLLAPTGGEMPHIVVKVSQLRVIQDALGLYDVLGDPDLDWWITVRNIYETSGGQRKLLTSMERGMVYRIKQLKFDESYVTPEPEMAPLDIEVIAEPIAWEAQEVEYDLN